MMEELRLLPAQLKAYQEQARIFLERILDIDQVGREVRKNTRTAYLCEREIWFSAKDVLDCPHEGSLWYPCEKFS